MGDLETIADALRQAEAALGALPVAVAQFSATMRYLWVSQRYAEWLGASRDKVIGASIKESDRARARRAGFAAHLTKPVEGGRLLGALEASRPAETGGLGA